MNINQIIEQYTLWLDTDGKEASRANLKGADLTWANLSGAKLSGANLTCANLKGADLTCANLVRCIRTQQTKQK